MPERQFFRPRPHDATGAGALHLGHQATQFGFHKTFPVVSRRCRLGQDLDPQVMVVLREKLALLVHIGPFRISGEDRRD